MADEIFISYARDNREAARILADTIEAKGYDVWWDRELIAGDDYTDKIEHLLDNAKAVIVLWSEQSRKSFWVRDEAAVGRDRNRLLPIAIDDNLPPLGFRQIHTISLKGWDGVDPEPLEDLWYGLEGLVGDPTGAAPPQPTVDNPFGGGAATTGRELAGPKINKKMIAAGINATPNHKSVQQILKEEKKQRRFLKTYWMTSFIISAIAALLLGAASHLSVDMKDETLSDIENLITNTIVVFFCVGLGLVLGRFLIVLGRRLSKRKSIRYFDQPTLICGAIAILLAALSAAAWLSEAPDAADALGWTGGDVLFYAPLFAFLIYFPICAMVSIPIGAVKGLNRKSFQDGS